MTISGSGFTPTSKVYFGTYESFQVTYQSSTTLIAATPESAAGSGSNAEVTVQVSTFYGSASAPTDYEYLEALNSPACQNVPNPACTYSPSQGYVITGSQGRGIQFRHQPVRGACGARIRVPDPGLSLA